MKLQRDTGFQFALVKEILDANAQKQQVEEKIRAAEEWQSLLLENAARREIDVFIEPKMHSATKAKLTMAVAQLSLPFENVTVAREL